MTYVLDAGAFVAVERANRRLSTEIKREYLAGRPPVTHGGVVGQVWRGGSGRQAGLARTLAWVHVLALGDALGRRAGELLAVAGTSDVIDAALILLAAHGDVVITSDPDDLRVLAAAARRRIQIVPV